MDLMAQAMRRSCAAKVAACLEAPVTAALLSFNKHDNNENNNNDDKT